MRSSALKSDGSTYQWRKIRTRILRRDQNTCMKCGQYGDTVDHIIPRSKGGLDTEDNLQCMCRKCNYSKGGRFFESASTPMTPLGLFSPENGSITHYNPESD